VVKKRSKIHPGAVIGQEDWIMKNIHLFCRKGGLTFKGNSGRIRLLLPALLVFFACSCSTDGSIQQILGKSVQAPVFLDCRPVTSTEIVFKFSLPVRVVSLNFDAGLETESVEDGSEVRISFSRALEEGKKITADILVEDADRNTLNVIVPFRARNDRMPALVFNELRFDNSSSNNKVEFVEFKVLEPGNLGAMRLFIAHQSLSSPFYEFPPAEVKAGEYVVLHTRTVEEGCVDETGENLGLSKGVEALSDARDFWIPGNKKLLHNTNGLWLLDQDDRIIDALLLSETADLAGVSAALAKTFAASAEFLGKKKAWYPLSGDAATEGWIPAPSDAVITKGTTNTRTLCRDETIPARPRADNWYITATSSATPGKLNNPKRYVP